MEFDIKNNLLKTNIGDTRLGQKNIGATIDNSLVTSTAQKQLDLDINQKDSSAAKKTEEEKKRKKKESLLAKARDNKANDQQKKIVRDPLVLLKLL